MASLDAERSLDAEVGRLDLRIHNTHCDCLNVDTYRSLRLRDTHQLICSQLGFGIQDLVDEEDL
jgi:hypothetical protein